MFIFGFQQTDQKKILPQDYSFDLNIRKLKVIFLIFEIFPLFTIYKIELKKGVGTYHGAEKLRGNFLMLRKYDVISYFVIKSYLFFYRV